MVNGIWWMLPTSVMARGGRSRSCLHRDSAQFRAVLNAIQVPQSRGWGRPRKRPHRLIADTDFGYAALRPLAAPGAHHP